jgi:DNA mismatch repair ATPase MutS
MKLTCFVLYRMNVARLANIPVSVIKKAKEKSDEMQKQISEIQLQNRNIRILQNIMQNKSIEQDDLLSLCSSQQ